MKIWKRDTIVLTAVSFLMFMAASPALRAEIIAEVNVHDRVGDGWHMYTATTVNSDGTISGTTKLENHNNIAGFTGGLFIVAVDKNMNPIYATGLHQWGVNAAFFSRSRTRTEAWTDKIPAEYLQDLASIAVVQQHTPTNRVWNWIYENRELIVEKAKLFLEFFKKAKDKALTEDDISKLIPGSP